MGRHLYLSTFLYIWGFCGVNSFGLISGYFGFRETKGYAPRFARYFSLWLQVVFYGLLMALVYKVLLPGEVTGDRFLNALLPVSTSEYWYFTAYTGVFFVAPLINLAVQALKPEDVKRSVWILLALFSVLATCSSVKRDIFLLNEGYSFLWLAVLYYIGAAMKKTGFLSDLRARIGWFWIAVLIIISELFMIISGRLSFEKPMLLIQHLSPTIVAISMLHIVVFSRLQLGETAKKIIRFAAPGAFAVYLLNANPCFWNYTLHGLFSFLEDEPLILMPITVILFAVAFVTAAVTVDWLRQKLWAVMQIDAACKALDRGLEHLFAPKSK